MSEGFCFLGGLGVGAGLMYFFDPDLGRSRRARTTSRATGLWHDTEDAFRVAGRDLAHRAQGFMAEARAAFSRGPADDHTLAERVRAGLGRVVSHPGALDVQVREGHATLSGPILANEVDDLLACVASVPGVTGLINRLDVHEQAGNIPALQGEGRPRAGTGLDLFQQRWSPATRLLVGGAGGLLFALGLSRRAPLACFLGTAGLAVGALGAAGTGPRALLGLGAHRQGGFEITKTINIAAPVDRVFQFWSNYHNFARFMHNVRGVTYLGEGRSRWVAAGPAGVPVEWTARVTRMVPNRELAWQSEPGSTVCQRGLVHFEDNGQGGTRVTVHLAYCPPAGEVGKAIANLFGADPKSEMDEDLMRLKSLLETGKLPHGARQEQPAAAP